MKRVWFLNFALLALCGFALAPRANADAVLSVSAPSNVALGQSFAVDVNIANAADLYAFQFDLGFNASVLSLTGISEGLFLPGAGATFFIPGTIDNTAGLASASADTLLTAVAGANGAGSLVVFDFTAIGTGVSDITLLNQLLLDSNISILNGTTQGGSISVGGNTSVPEPSSIALLLIGLLAVLAGRIGVHRLFTGRFVRNALIAVVLAFLFSSCAPAQTAPIISTTLTSDAILGFETPLGWTAKSSASSQIMVSSTTARTQGNFAHAVSNPGNLVTLTSGPVASTAAALVGVGNAGALFQVDVLLPIQVGNINNTGQIQMYVNSPSRGLSKVLIGNVAFSSFRPGIYNTMKFPIPTAVGTALGGAAFNDLTFLFMVSSPGQLTGTYLFDNLRVHSVQLVPATTGTKPPPGYGGSVDLVVIGGTPTAGQFGVGIVQIPDGFHLKLGTAGATTIQLDLGYGGTSSITCTYQPNSTDQTGKSYTFGSCTGGLLAGDLVGADWAGLKIVGGDPTMKLRAQLAKNPMGDLAGTGLLPPMPTFWGDFDTCAPALPAPPVANQSLPVSASCAAQLAEAHQIVTNYFNTVNNANVSPNWIVTPSPEFARRHGVGTPYDTSTGPPPPGDPAFDKSGSVNPGGSFDAGYHAWGNLNPVFTADNHATAHAEANLTGNLVLFGQNVEAAKLASTVDIDSGQITPTNIGPPTATGSLRCFVFGSELPNNGPQDITTGFNFNCHDTREISLNPISVWIFSVTPGPTVGYGLTASGTVSPSAFNISVAPDIALGAHIFGGVDVFVASGGVDARVDLLDASPQFTAAASWLVSTAPKVCSANLNYSGAGNVQLSSGGGQVDLVASFGICPFCHDESWKIFDWGALTSTSFPVFAAGDSPSKELPISLCQVPLQVSINSPSSSVNGGIFYPLTATATRPPSPSTNNAVTGFANIDCSNGTFTWSLSPDPSLTGDSIVGQGCNASVKFNSQNTTPRTLTLNVEYDVLDSAGTNIPESGSAQRTIAVTPLASGSHIVGSKPLPISSVPIPSPYDGKFLSFSVGQFPTDSSSSIVFVGEFVGSGATTAVWTATAPDINNGAPVLIGNAPIDAGTGFSFIIWTVPHADTYTITLSAINAAGTAVSSPASVTAFVQQNVR